MTKDNKAPKTTMESIFDAKELQTFTTAKTTWQGITKDTIAMIGKISEVGNALNLLYDKGAAKGLKKNQIAQMASEHFQGLTEVDRSVYRKLTSYTEDLIDYVNRIGIKSDNPRYLFNKYLPKRSTETTLKSICSDVRKAITADILSAKQMAQIERELTMTLALIHSVQEAEIATRGNLAQMQTTTKWRTENE